ncbi:cytochrome P450 2D9-like [Oppia nitens]|uniref:cytochrome P450 2D9-like n=1 Tax=Oppia nitens TaxID=1686743 RepID=UPI0023DC5AF6|nr:cytochrome P450 2D9-like [Oppia nitens]
MKIYGQYAHRKRFPPGPRNWPLIGSVFSITGANPKTFADWSKKYGPVIGIHMGSSPTVLLNDWPSIKDALLQDTTLDRPVDNLFASVAPKGISSMNGQEYRDQKKFLSLWFKKIKSKGKPLLEDLIIDEIQQLFHTIDKIITIDFEIPVRSLFGLSLFNIGSKFLLGQRFDYTNIEMLKLIDNFFATNPNLALNSIFGQFPNVNKFLIKYFNFLLQKSANGQANIDICTIIKNEITSHEKTLDTNKNDNNYNHYMDTYIRESRKQNIKIESSVSSGTLDNSLVGIIFDLYGGQVLSMINPIEWSLVLLATYPDVQQKVYREIVSILGTNGRPMYEQRNQLPYVQAFIYEVMRFRSITPLNLQRMATADTIIGGQFVPKGTHILINFWSVSNDPNLWDEPNRFRPERFLIDGETKFVKPEYLIPFSFGKRTCPGEVSALMQLFFYTILLIQKYEIKATKNTDTTLDYEFQLSVAPKREPVVGFVKRYD